MTSRLEYHPDETLPELEYSAHCLYAEARGLVQLMRAAHSSERDAVKDELREAADFILKALETEQ